MPLVLMANVGGLNRISTHTQPQQEMDDILQWHVSGVWRVPAAPTQMIPHAIFRDAFQGAI
jgi:hypothetical protein